MLEFVVKLFPLMRERLSFALDPLEFAFGLSKFAAELLALVFGLGLLLARRFA